MKADQSVSRLAAVFTAMAALLVVSLIITFVMGMWTIKRTASVLQYRRATDDIILLLSTLKDAETGQRGFLLTNDPSYLEPYNEARETINKQLARLDQEAKDGYVDPNQLHALSGAISVKLLELSDTLETFTKVGQSAAIAAVKENRGKVAMDQIRAQAQLMLESEEQNLQAARNSSDQLNTLRTITFVIVGVTNLAFLVWAFGRIRDEMDAHHAAGEEVRRQRELLSVTLSSIGDGVIVTDARAQITFMNSVAEELTQWKLTEARGKQLPEVFRICNEATRQPVENPVTKVLRTGTVVGLANHTLLLRRDGSELPIDDSGAPIKDNVGNLHGVVLVFRDFSEHKQNERDLVQAKNIAEAASRAKDQFLATLSHELRTPLTPVLATLTSWQDEKNIPSELREDVLVMRRNVELEARLIDDLLDLTRIARGKIQLHHEVEDVHKLLKSTCDICKAEADDKRITISFELLAASKFVRADSARMQQVFWNIIRNGIKFTMVGGKIVIRTVDDGSHIRIEFEDDGIGMSDETLSRVFQPFEQGADDITRRYGGLGLGLAISKALVDVQGGIIGATSDGTGKGATFIVKMPTVQAPADGYAKQPRPVLSSPRLLNILMVEDHVDSARTMGRLLRKLGHGVKLADSVSSATDLINTESFDLLLSDIGLPDGTGIDLIRYVRQKHTTPAIALTGYGMEEDISKCMEAGFNAHITKPVNFQNLEAMIEKVTSAPRKSI